MIALNCNDLASYFDVSRLAQDACNKIAPAWPLDRSIAVNPYWGFRHRSFEQAVEEMAYMAGSPMAMPPEYYREKYRAGEITEASLMEAIHESGDLFAREEMIRFLDSRQAPLRQLPLLSDLIDIHREATHTCRWHEHILTQISQCCASFFDRFQSEWPIDGDCALYPYWLEMMREDRGSEYLMQNDKLRQRSQALPGDALQLLDMATDRLQLSPDQIPLLFAVALHRVQGWASRCAQAAWQANLAGQADPGHCLNLLAIRVAWELLLDDGLRSASAVWSEWQIAWQQCLNTPQPDPMRQASIWLRAEELSYQHRLLAVLDSPPLPQSAVPRVQAVFCIDVRSEPIRRAIEKTDPSINTLGFAGFFGVPMELLSLGSDAALPHLPGLLQPKLTALQTTGSTLRDQTIAEKLVAGKRFEDEFSRLPASGLFLVETLGMGKVFNLCKAAFPSNRRHPRSDAAREANKIQLNATAQQKAELAERFLRATGLDSNHAPLVILVGHASQTTNNPTAAALNCGACGGQSGLNNARAMRDILRDPEVVAELDRRGIRLAKNTMWVAGIHNTTLEIIELDPPDLALIPSQLQVSLQRTFESAGNETRLERLRSNGGADGETLPSVVAAQAQQRASNWAETRPEWGLANNAALIVGPRARTRGLNLEGRCFLHEYDCSQDIDGSLLEQIVTAPMIVAHWINMQYFASTVDPQRFGAGNKALHNVVGGSLGLFEGNSGDLRIGLPLQSLHDGKRWRHSPMRLTVIVFASRDKMERVIERTPLVRQLMEGRWIDLILATDTAFERMHDDHDRAKCANTTGQQRATCFSGKDSLGS